jgi:hypothetical protein
MTQKPPHGDNRYRVHHSARFYVAEVMVSSTSAAWHFSESTERIVYRWFGGGTRVSYRGRYLPIHRASEMEKLVKEHLARGLPAFIGGKTLHPDEDDDLSFDPYPFIDTTRPEEQARYRAFLSSRARFQTDDVGHA